jgi:anti-sigma B factor antagonist
MAVKTSRLEGGIGIIDVHGNLVGGEETIAFQQAIMDLLSQRCEKLVLDFRGVPFINSTGLGVLISAHTSSVRRGCQLLLCNVNSSVNSLLVITGLCRILEMKETREEAVGAMVQ